MRGTAFLIAAIVFAASGCGSGETGPGDALDGSTESSESSTTSRSEPTTTVDSEPTTTTHSEPTIAAHSDCADPDQDVANEPDWRQYATYEEWTRDGCLIRIDFLAERVDSDCDLSWPQIMVTGDPLGTPYETAADALQYLRDDRDIRSEGESLPSDAQASGYTASDGRELWTVPGEPSAIFIVSSERVERWPLGQEEGCG